MLYINATLRVAVCLKGDLELLCERKFPTVAALKGCSAESDEKIRSHANESRLVNAPTPTDGKYTLLRCDASFS